MLSRKYYRSIAAALNGVVSDFEISEDCSTHSNQIRRELMQRIIGELGREFRADNPRFDLDRFREAVWNG